MNIAQTYSHLNGEEYLLVHHRKLYIEIKDVITGISANEFRTKISKEKRKIGNSLFSPKELNRAFYEAFYKCNWEESRYNYYITLNRELMEKSILMPAKEQKQFLEENGEKAPIYSYNQTDFVKDKIAVEIQFGKYSFVAFDLFVKHMMFYS
ncbi:MAG TPA: BglII/BstYI family type II restriction endonuclease, partial [Candidatus Babeliaceae bacterium]|nr:BglII/BstYI family type II restriction endonuclease [Candidatus Babeliaceae bacterium]